MRRAAILLAFVSVLLLPAGPSAAFLSFEGVTNRFIQFVIRQINVPGEFELTVGTLTEGEDGYTTLEGFSVADREGVWLSAERVALDWSPAALLRGEISLSLLRLEDVDLRRLPLTGDTPEEEGGEEEEGGIRWPRAPLGVEIAELVLTRLTVADTILPEAATLTATGAFRDIGDVQSVRVAAERTDGVGATLDLDMTRDFTADTLKARIRFDEPQGGLVARLAGIPEAPAVSLALDADGPPTDWGGALAASVEGYGEVNGTASAAWAGPLSLAADVMLTPGARLAPEIAAAIGEAAQLDIAAREGGEGRVALERARFRLAAGRVDARGDFARTLSDIAIDMRADVPEEGARLLDPFLAPATVKGAGLDIAVRGSAAAPRLTMQGRVETVATPDATAASLDLDARIALSGSAVAGDVRMVARDPELTGRPDLTGLLGPDIAVEADGRYEAGIAELARFSLASRMLEARGEGRFDTGAGEGSGQLRVAATDLAPLAAFAGQDLRGGATLTADVRRARLDGALDADLRLAGRGLESADALAAALLAGRVDAEATVRTDDARVVRLSPARIETGAISARAEGEVDLAARTAQVRYGLSAADIGPIAEAAGVQARGALTAEGDLAGAFDAPAARGEARLTDAAVNGERLGRVTVAHDVAVEGGGPSGSLRLAVAGSRLGDGTGEARFRTVDGVLDVTRVEASLLGLAAEGEARVPLDGSPAAGTLALTVRDLRPAGRLAGLEVSGTGRADVTLSANGDAQGVRATAGFRNLRSGESEIASVRAALSVRDLAAMTGIDATATADGAVLPQARLGTVTASARGSLGALRWEAAADGDTSAPVAAPLMLSAGGTADLAGRQQRVRVGRLDLGYAEETFALSSPLDIVLAGGETRLQGLDLLAAEGRVRGDLSIGPRVIVTDLSIQDLPLRLVRAATGRGGVTGALSGTVAVRTGGRDAGGTVRLETRGLSAGQGISAEGLDLALAADWDGRTLSADLTAQAGEANPVRGALSLPLVPARSGALPSVPRGGQIDGALDWEGDVAPLWAVAPLPDHILEGKGVIHLKVEGPLDGPRVSGRVGLSDGVYENLVSGTYLADLTLDTELANTETVAWRLTGTDGAKGRVEGEGTVTVGGERIFVLDTGLRFENALLVRRDEAVARMTGEVRAEGDGRELGVTGALTTDFVEVRLLNRLPPSIVTLDVRFPDDPPEDPAAARGEGVIRVPLDIRIDMPQRVFVRGRGLESEWGGTLEIGGSAAAPSVVGTIAARRGYLDFIGRSFEIERGEVRFSGATPPSPAVDLVLTREANDVTGRIEIFGTAAAPEIAFSSTPGLPEDEVLPRVLFGKSAQSMSALEALQLASGVATLLSGEAGVIDSLRGALGVDVLRVEGGETEGEAASVSVGSYVADGVFVGTKQPLDGRGGSVLVEVEITDRITVDTEVGQEGNTSAGLNWRYDY
ncbi:MAG: translocation/assembly module TamB domain-containing protein [Alphaproteobacteria bacterium]|nr:translocation/assembly module TamB domain-containing protein [Alphaproteobacteria bacterium]MDX5370710.1 translocation/assembly module TamB domain-containing protein [Alphaproteobacteria bacterium]MDX5465127.1 translocation/assembly module TamB domain-containing protein [Alphaproteobacteria bacterium]